MVKKRVDVGQPSKPSKTISDLGECAPQENEKSADGSPQHTSCVVCLANAVSIRLSCGHAAFCSECSQSMPSVSELKCPLCLFCEQHPRFHLECFPPLRQLLYSNSPFFLPR